MNTITKLVVLVIICLIANISNAQDTIQKAKSSSKIETYEQVKDSIIAEEKNLLKVEVEAINQKLEQGEISKEKADELKQEVARKRALNIENRLAILDNQIALYKRNKLVDSSYAKPDKGYSLSIGGDRLLNFETPRNKKPPKYDIKTSNQLLFAIGFNNTIIDGQNLDDSPYEIGGSGFVELGWLWKTRLLENSNFVRMSYGLSLQWNKLSIKDNLYFVDVSNQTVLEEFPLDLKKSKFRITSLVVPLHFEFGPSKKKDYEDRIRFFTDDQFKIGLGGFAGVNLSTQQKLKFEEDGDRQKEKVKKDFNTTNLVYGLSAYVGVGDFSVYAKYNLNDLFKNQDVDQNNVSLGLRWALD